MFAVIKTGGKQYRVAANDVVTIEKLDAEAGAVVEFNEILVVGVGADAKFGALLDPQDDPAFVLAALEPPPLREGVVRVDLN